MSPPQRSPQHMQQQTPQEMLPAFTQYLEDRVERRLARSTSLAGTDIDGSVEQRTVTLQGTVGSEQDKQRAEQLARRTRGVQEVKDELRIDQQAVEKRRNVEVEDDVLAKQVATKLAEETFPLAEAEEGWLFGWEVEGYNWEFDVEVDDGVVTLEGEVDAYGDMSEAIQAARAVPGVRAVEADLWVDRFGYGRYYNPYYYHP